MTERHAIYVAKQTTIFTLFIFFYHSLALQYDFRPCYKLEILAGEHCFTSFGPSIFKFHFERNSKDQVTQRHRTRTEYPGKCISVGNVTSLRFSFQNWSYSPAFHFNRWLVSLVYSNTTLYFFTSKNCKNSLASTSGACVFPSSSRYKISPIIIADT